MHNVRVIAVVLALVLGFALSLDRKVTAQKIVCPDALPSFLDGKERGRVTITPPGKTPIPVRVHSEPGLKSEGVAQLTDGTSFDIVDGPQCVDRLVWWQIRTHDERQSGWVAEGDSSGYFIEPVETAPTPTPQVTKRSQQPITYHDPLAYVGADNNLYVTDLHSGAGSQLTTDGAVPVLACGSPGNDATDSGVYTTIQWSPAGGQFVVADTQTPFQILKGLLLFRTGQKPVALASITPTGKEDLGTHFSWSPDGSQIAYPGYTSTDDTQTQLMTVSPGDGATRAIGPMKEFDTGWGSGPCADPEYGWRLLDLGSNGSGGFWFRFEWTPTGLLYATGEYGLTMVDLNNQVVWEHDPLFGAVVTHDGSHAVASIWEDRDTFKSSPVWVDMKTGTYTPTSLPEHGVWSADDKTLFYSEGTALWRVVSSGGQPTQVIAFPEGQIGAIAPSPDNQGVVLTLITLQPVNVPPSRLVHSSHVAYVYLELLYVDLATDKATFVAFGRQPAFGKGSFTAIQP